MAVEEFEVRLEQSKAIAAMKQLSDAVDAGFAKMAKSAEDAGGKLRENLSDEMTKQIAIGNLVSAAVSGAYNAISTAITNATKSALEYERSMIQQEVTLKAFAIGSAQASAVLEAQSTVIERLTGVSQENIRTMQNRAIVMGISVGATDELIRASIGMANVLGRNVNEVMTQLIKSQSGSLDETLNSIDAFKSLTKEQLRNGDAIRLANDLYGKFVDLNTRGGGVAASLVQIETAFGNTGKAIARMVTEAEKVKGAFEFAADLSFLVQRMTENAKGASEEFQKLFKHFDPLTLTPITANIRLIGIAVSWLADRARKAQDEEAKHAGAIAETGAMASQTSVKVTDYSNKVRDIALRAIATQERHAEEARKAAREYDELARAIGSVEDATKAFGIMDLRKPPEPPPLIPEAKLRAREEQAAAERMTLAERYYTKYGELVMRSEDGINQLVIDRLAHRDAIEEQKKNDSLVRWDSFGEKMKDIAASGFGTFASMGISALEKLVEGQKVNAAEFLRDFMAMLGKQLIASGVAHLAQAGFMYFSPDPTMVARAPGATSSALAEIAVGTAFTAGNLALGAAGVGVSASGGGGRGAANYRGSMGGAPSQGFYDPNDPVRTGGPPRVRRVAREMSDTTEGITIVVNGPTMLTQAEIGVAIERARRAAAQRAYV